MMDEFDFPNYTPPPTKENLELVKLLAEVQNNPMQWEHTTRFPTTPELYWYQKDALKAVIQNKQQLLVFPTGKGKTMVALAAIQHYHSHTVIIAPTIYLCHQWASEIEKCGGSCTIVSSETGNIFANTTIITYASALQHITEIAQYDLVVFDEAHHVVAPEYYRIAKGIIAVNKFKKLIGLTASPNTHGEDKKLQDAIFPTRYVLTIAQLQHSDQAVHLNLIATPVTLSDPDRRNYDNWWNIYTQNMKYFGGYPQMVKATRSSDSEIKGKAFAGLKSHQNIKRLLSEHTSKIGRVVDLVRHTDGNYVVFGETIKMVDTIHDLLTQYGVPAIKIHSKLKQNAKEKDQIMAALRSGDVRVLVGAYAIEEGLDIPVLDNAVFVCEVTSSDLKIIQRAGRVMRAQPGKEVKIHVIYAENTIESTNLAKIRKIVGASQ